MNIIERLVDAQRRPNAYFLQTFGEVVAFVVGMDAATEWTLLAGFGRWLSDRSGHGASLAWPVLIAMAAFPNESEIAWKKAIGDGSDVAKVALFENLIEFLRYRNAGGSESLCVSPDR